MNNLSVKTLLPFALALIVVKWIVLPTLEWQSSSSEKLLQGERLLQKSEHIIENKMKYDNITKELNESMVNAEVYFFEKTATTRLDIQRALESRLNNNEISIVGFDWLNEQSIGNVDEYLIKVNVQGMLINLARFQLALSDVDDYTKYQLIELRVASQRGNGGIDNFRGELFFKAYAIKKKDKDKEEERDASQTEPTVIPQQEIITGISNG